LHSGLGICVQDCGTDSRKITNNCWGQLLRKIACELGLDLVIRVTVCEKQIKVAIVIVVKELHAPTAHESRSAADAERAGHVVESEIVIVAIDGIHFLVNIGNEQVQPAEEGTYRCRSAESRRRLGAVAGHPVRPYLSPLEGSPSRIATVQLNQLKWRATARPPYSN
jgi:hypothetical protein